MPEQHPRVRLNNCGGSHRARERRPRADSNEHGLHTYRLAVVDPVIVESNLRYSRVEHEEAVLSERLA